FRDNSFANWFNLFSIYQKSFLKMKSISYFLKPSGISNFLISPLLRNPIHKEYVLNRKLSSGIFHNTIQIWEGVFQK
ncbi:hypothetical protein L9F63_009694, partial [Diploptera punctata]